MLHELGHHVYHRGEERAGAVEAARTRRASAHLLNLVADEHLERNLRALDRDVRRSPEAARRLRVPARARRRSRSTLLLAALRGATADGADRRRRSASRSTSDSRAPAARRRARRARARRASARALRARAADGPRQPPRRSAASRRRSRSAARHPRSSTCPGSTTLTRGSPSMFGGSIALAHGLRRPRGPRARRARRRRVTAPASTTTIAPARGRAHPRSRGAATRRASGRATGCLHQRQPATSDFDRITPRRSACAATPRRTARSRTEVTRHAARLRALPRRPRAALGAAARAPAAAARSIARACARSSCAAIRASSSRAQPVRSTDLFLGMLIDCSGSMRTGDNIERARRFAVLVAEAVRAARRRRCAVLRLHRPRDLRRRRRAALRRHRARGRAAATTTPPRCCTPRNVAAALAEAREAARDDQRRPADRVLGRRAARPRHRADATASGIVCAQVAVRRLDEVCFPHYVVLDDGELDVAVARFGRMIARPRAARARALTISRATAHMAGKWNVDELDARPYRRGDLLAEPRRGAREFRFRATHLDGRRAPKVVLSSDDRASSPGVPCLVRIVAMHKPEREDRGAHRGRVRRARSSSGSRASSSIRWSSKKLQVLLESGLNILLDGPQGCGKTVLARSIADSARHGVRVLQLRRGRRGDRLPRHDPGARVRDRAQPVTDFVKTDVLIALEEAGEHPERALPRVPRRAQPLPGERAQRADAGARLDAPHVPPDREPLHRDPGQRAVHRRRQPRARVLRHVRHRRRPARPLRAAADGLPAAEGRDEDPRAAATPSSAEEPRADRRRSPTRSASAPDLPGSAVGARHRRGVHLPRAPAVRRGRQASRCPRS